MSSSSANYFKFLGLTFDWATIVSTSVAFVVVLTLGFVLSRKITMKPTGGQNVLEAIVDFTNSIVKGQLSSQMARDFGLYIFTLFLFILVSNEMGMLLSVKVPAGHGGEIELLKSPTSSPVVTMTLALMSSMVAHFTGVAKNGLKGYFKNVYLSPFSFLLPINLIEQMANFLTLGLRLFGNIFAGEVLLNLLAQAAFPGNHFQTIWQILLVLPLAMAWQGFSLFIGAIQAFVFATLTTVYTSELSSSEED